MFKFKKTAEKLTIIYNGKALEFCHNADEILHNIMEFLGKFFTESYHWSKTINGYYVVSFYTSEHNELIENLVSDINGGL